jgi:uncharacterized protein YukE
VARPSGWDVVDQWDDPVKGDPSTLRMMAREYKRISDAADDASTRLKSVKGSGWLTDWQGEAADVFVDAIKDTPSDLGKLVDSYSRASTALSGWADTVDDAQYRADGALADAKDAAGDLASAQSRLSDAQSTLSHYQQTSTRLTSVAKQYPAGSDVPDGVDVPTPSQLRAASDNATVAQGSVSSAQGDISAAQSRIDAAKRLVAEAKGDWQDGEQRTAKAIGDAADAGLGKQSFWDKVFGSEAWSTIVSIAKVVVFVGGIVAMIIPGPWTLIIAAIALVVVADTLFKMSKGQADGWDLAFALLDCVPLASAVGRAAGLARMGSKLVSASATASRVVNAGRRVANGVEQAKSALSTKGRDVIARLTSAFRRGEARRSEVQAMGHSYFDEASYRSFYESGDSTLGAPGRAFFFMPEEDALAYVHNPIDAMVQTGLAPSVRNAVMRGEPVYGIRFPLEGTSPRLPTFEDAAGNVNYTPGGHTAVAFEGGHMINPTHERVIEGGRPLQPNTEIFQLLDSGERLVVRAIG